MFNVRDTAVFIRLEDKLSFYSFTGGKPFWVMSDSDTSSVKSETVTSHIK